MGMDRYIFDAFMTMRFATPGPMGGYVARTWQEVAAFVSLSEGLGPFEAQALFEMSWSYVEEFHKAENPLRIPPMDRGHSADFYQLEGNPDLAHKDDEPTT